MGPTCEVLSFGSRSLCGGRFPHCVANMQRKCKSVFYNVKSDCLILGRICKWNKSDVSMYVFYW